MFSFLSLLRATGRARPYLSAAVICLAATLAQAGETTNKIGITMVDIPAGSFQMGSGESSDVPPEENNVLALLGQASSSDSCNYSDQFVEKTEIPRHSVNIKAFQIAKTEVTVGQFKQFIAATGNTALMNDKFKEHNDFGDDASVIMISWNDAQAFIDWLNKTDGGGYRLPSEAEWEYACRAGGYHLFCGSNSADGLIWAGGDSTAVKRPPEPAAGAKLANAFGLYDMSGNVKEWAQDCWHDDYNGAPDDGSARIGGECEFRVSRGGSWRNCISSLRAAFRTYYSPDERNPNFGFRIARTR